MTQREEEKAYSGLELDEGHLLRSGYRDPLRDQTPEVSTHRLHAEDNSAWDWQGQWESHNVFKIPFLKI